MEIEFDGKTYRIGKIDARAQFHIIRRLAPILGDLVPAVKTNGGGDALQAITGALAKLSDADADYCIFGLLKAVSRKQPNDIGWGAVTTGESLMYDDMTMPMMLQLSWQVLKFNMSGFFAGLPAGLKEAFQKASDK
jgi:hypothetical protein